MKVAIDFSDGLIIGSENISDEISSYLKQSKTQLRISPNGVLFQITILSL